MSVWIVAAASSAVCALPERPGARLLVADREERDQSERVLQPRAPPRRAPTARRGSPPPPRPAARRAPPPACSRSPGPVLERDQRLGRERVELAPAARRPVGERAAGVEVRDERLQHLGLGALAPRRRTSPPSPRARAGVRRGRGRRRAARAAASRDRRPASRPTRSRPARPGSRRPGAGCRGAPGRSRARRRRGPPPASPSARRRARPAAARRSSAIAAMPTFGFSVTDAYAVISAPARVRALNRVVLPLFGSPTMPTSSAMTGPG